jgi:hypothetical protein
MQPFSGRILSREWMAPSDLVFPADALPTGPVRMTLRLPQGGAPRSEPLVSSGEPGRGDLVFITYLSPRSISIGFDHWGYGGPKSAPIAVDPNADVVVTIDYGALHEQPEDTPEPAAGSPGHLFVAVNGKTAIDEPHASYRCSRALVSMGENIIGASSVGAEFTGTMVAVAFRQR